MSAHTPGPWRIESDPPTRCGGPRVVAKGSSAERRVAVADVWDVDGIAGGTGDNARLIAAAPTLLAALRALVEALDNGQGTGEELIEARAVLAAAETPHA